MPVCGRLAGRRDQEKRRRASDGGETKLLGGMRKPAGERPVVNSTSASSSMLAGLPRRHRRCVSPFSLVLYPIVATTRCAIRGRRLARLRVGMVARHASAHRATCATTPSTSTWTSGCGGTGTARHLTKVGNGMGRLCTVCISEHRREIAPPRSHHSGPTLVDGTAGLPTWGVGIRCRSHVLTSTAQP